MALFYYSPYARASRINASTERPLSRRKEAEQVEKPSSFVMLMVHRMIEYEV